MRECLSLEIWDYDSKCKMMSWIVSEYSSGLSILCTTIWLHQVFTIFGDSTHFIDLAKSCKSVFQRVHLSTPTPHIGGSSCYSCMANAFKVNFMTKSQQCYCCCSLHLKGYTAFDRPTKKCPSSFIVPPRSYNVAWVSFGSTISERGNKSWYLLVPRGNTDFMRLSSFQPRDNSHLESSQPISPPGTEIYTFLPKTPLFTTLSLSSLRTVGTWG